MDSEKLKLYTIVFVMGIATTVMNFTNSILASFVGLLISSIIVHAIGLIPSTIFFLTYERDGLKGWKSIFKRNPMIFMGGVVGAYCVILISYCIGKTGVFFTTLGLLAGQFIMSFIIDINGWFGFPKMKPGPLKLLSLFIMIAGIILISM